MRTRNLGFAAAALSLAAVLASCSDDDPTGSDDGGQTPISPPATSASQPGQALPHSGAPKVATPIADTSQWEGDPCSVITADQLQTLGLSVPSPQREDVPTSGPGCNWEFDAETVSSFTASFATAGARDGISNMYRHKELGTAEVFEELPPIEGHPAVIAEPKDERSDGVCGVTVGLRDDLALGIDITADPSTPQGKDPCGWAAKVAALAVQTMKGSS